MSKYYLSHAIFGTTPEKIMKILEDGYLRANIYTGEYGLYYDTPLEYVYFSLLGDIGVGGTTFILSTNVLYRRSFRYALTWVGHEIDRTTKVNFRYDNVDQVLDKINNHVVKESVERPGFETSFT